MFLVSFIWYRHKGSARGSERTDRAERGRVGGASPGAWEGSQGRQSAALGSLHTGATLGQTGLSPTKVRDTGRGRQVTACCHHHLRGLSQPTARSEILNPTEKLQWVPVSPSLRFSNG